MAGPPAGGGDPAVEPRLGYLARDFSCGVGGRVKRQALLFPKKKAKPPAKQKDFFNLGHWRLNIPAQIAKVFAPFFSKSGFLLL
jgi:hypothetical protein